MAVGYHIIFGAYGFWLPNDPRGSWSDYVGAFELFKVGRATKTREMHSVAKLAHDRDKRLADKSKLKLPAVRFSGVQARDVGAGFADYASKSELIVWACAVMPDHVHLVIDAHRLEPEQIAIQLRARATRQLMTAKTHPFLDAVAAGARPPKCFARGEWVVYLDTADDLVRAIRYVEDNPVKDGMKAQKWSFVKPCPARHPPSASC